MDRKINLIDILKDKASILRATLSINRHVSSIHVAILRATSHDPSSPPSDEKIADILDLGRSSRLAACTCIDILMDRLHVTQNAFVALKCLYTVHNIVSRGSFIFRDQISYHPSFGGRNFLNMTMFSDKSDLDTWEFSLWVRWYAAVVEQNLMVARAIGYYLNTENHNKVVVALLNSDLVADIEVLVGFVARISDAPESLSLQRNDLVYEIVKAASEDYRAVQREISVRVKEVEDRVERLSLSELTRVVEALRRLEDCKERLVLLFVNRKRNDGLWESVRKTREELAETKAQREERRLVVVRTVSRNRGRDELGESTQCWNPFLGMSGAVPEGIAELPSLETLLIWNNYFSGNLPQDLGRNSNLMWVDVSTNNFNGSIPADICVKGVLFKLMLFSNNFSGSLVPSLSNCSSLVRLRLEDNSFSGEIPLKFSNFRDLSYIDLSENKLTGGIPIDIDQAPKLEYFNVSNNPELGGTIPVQTWSLPVLQNFSASSCSIVGNLPAFGSCKSISVIELNMNSLSGGVPDSVSSCRALERFGLANNNLSGHIPEELASLPALRVLDLSHNSLDGPIPSKFGSSSSLSLLNVSFNDISGTIPSGKVVKTMGSSAFVGNPKLCGEPLRSCPGSVAIFGSRGTGKLIWVLLLCAGIVTFLALSALGVLYFYKGSKGQWKMVSFAGLPQFTASDVLKSFSSIESMDDALSPTSASVCKAVLPTGITVSVKKFECDPKIVKVMLPFITRIGSARHKNLIRLLGFCYNKHLVYLLYDYLPNGSLSENIRVKREWAAKYKIVVSIARGLCFLHHECHPAIGHGDLRSSNIMFDENMEPHLTEFGFKHLLELNKTSGTAETSTMDTGAANSSVEEELYRDVYSFGEIMLEILSNGRLTNSGASLHSKSRESVLREIINENEVGSNTSVQQEIKRVLEVATLCTRSRPSDRPSMEDTLKLLQAR